MGRPYTGWDGDAKGKRPGTEKFVQLVCFISANKLWNNGTWAVRAMNNANAPTRPSVHGTGRAADLSWRPQKERGRGGSYVDAQKMLDFLVQYAEVLRIEEIHDYFPAPHGRGWRCDRASWKVYDKPTIGSAPGGDWIHVEISPEHADDPGYYDQVFKGIFAGEVKPTVASTPAPAPVKPVDSANATSMFKYPGTPIKVRSKQTDAVKLVQAALKTTVDGKFGNETKKAVETFQQANKLPVTGEVDDKTWAKLLG